jgi:hypothetical protein
MRDVSGMNVKFDRTDRFAVFAEDDGGYYCYRLWEALRGTKRSGISAWIASLCSG